MTLIDPENLKQASTFIHVCQGGALLILGAAEAYAADNQAKKINFLPPAAFMLSGALMLVSMLYFLGNWHLQPLLDALELKKGFYIFPAFAWLFAAAGLGRMMALYMGEKGGFWQFLFLVFLCVIALLYFTVPYRVNEAARLPVLAFHSAMGISLLAAVVSKSLHVFMKKKILQIIWAVLILITAGQLLIYRENPQAFEYHVVTIQSSPEQPPAAKDANAKPVDKKRPSN